MSLDTTSQLRSLYQSAGSISQIFGSKVADCSASRPYYPAPLVNALWSQCHLTTEAAIADECLRVLRPAGQVALIWNDRLFGDPLHLALDQVFAPFGGEKRAALLAHEDRALVPRFFGVGRFQTFQWPHDHVLSEEGLLCLVLSRSYMPERKSEPGQRAVDRVREVFQALAMDKHIVVRYTTVLMLGRPREEQVGKG